MQHFPKISFLTTCKGRLHHLAETMPKNIVWNMDYPNVEFVLLDYNSQDGLEQWVKSKMGKMIDNNKLVYYKYLDSEYYRFAHARNIAIKLATGDIVCNLDADNFTGENFAFYINEKLKNTDWLCGSIFAYNIFHNILTEDSTHGFFGRLAIHKEKLIKLGGYLESIECWGFEDYDLYLRLIKHEYKCETIPLKYLRCLHHSDLERGANTKEKIVGKWSESHNTNQKKSREYFEKGIFIANNGIFGQGKVYKNFATDYIEIH